MVKMSLKRWQDLQKSKNNSRLKKLSSKILSRTKSAYKILKFQNFDYKLFKTETEPEIMKIIENHS